MTSKGEKGILTLYSDVQATSVRWLWYPFIAVGKITLLQGDPGDGKSTMMMHLIAELSKGGTLPDGKTIGMPQRAIYQCSEDGISDTIKPRLEKCGADCRNVAFINEETYSGLTLDDERIRQAIIEFRPRLVVIDPIQACKIMNLSYLAKRTFKGAREDRWRTREFSGKNTNNLSN